MGKSWTSPEQKLWLQNMLPQYHDEQKKDRTTRFLLTVNEEWFKKFPEEDGLLFSTEPGQTLSAEEDQQLAQAKELRKKQILNWFAWAVRPRRTSSSPSQASTFVAAMQDRPRRKRAPHRTEVYQRLYPRKIKVEIQRELDAIEGPITPATRMRIHRQVTSAMLSQETLAVIAQVDGQIALWRENHAKEEREAVLAAQRAASQTPEQFQAAIDGLPGLLKKALTACANTTGWVFFLSAAGPTPVAGGDIYMQNYYFGPKSPAGNDFIKSYLDFDRGFSQPFSSHVRNCFPLAVRESRSLHGGDDARSSSAPSVTTVDSGNSQRSRSGTDSNQETEGDTDNEFVPDLEDRHDDTDLEDQHDDTDLEDQHSNGDNDLHSITDQHGSGSGSQSPGPSVRPYHIMEPVAFSQGSPSRSSTPPAFPLSVYARHDGPSSPIEHAFARMARHLSANPPSLPFQKSPTPEEDNFAEDPNIDPMLLAQSRTRPEDSILLDQSNVGFVYAPAQIPSAPATTASETPPSRLLSALQKAMDYTIPDARMETPLDDLAYPSPSPTNHASATSGTLSTRSDGNQSDAMLSTADSQSISVDSLSGEDLTPAQKRARTIAAKKAAAAVPVLSKRKRSATHDAERTRSSKRQQGIPASSENGRPRRATCAPRRADASPPK